MMAPDTQAHDAIARPIVRLWTSFAAGVLVVAALGYSFTGSPNRLTSKATAIDSSALAAPAATADPQSPEDQIAGIIERLAQRLKGQPDDAAGWSLLARAYSAMGRYGEAVSAYKKAVPLAESADLLADYADALAGQNQGKLDSEATRQINRALVLEPGNPKALALAGRVAFDKSDYAGAVRQWEKVERALPPDSALMAPLQASIAEARQLGRLPASDKAEKTSPDPLTPSGAEATIGTAKKVTAPAQAGQQIR
jgi:cytochrome c-type biogenesis protein CcmH